MAAKEAIQCPGFWWCACGNTSSLGPGGLRSLGVCVELLLVVVTSSLLPPASAELQREREREWNANRIKTQLRLIMPMMMMMMLLLMFDAWCGDKLTPDARTTTLCGGCLSVPPFSHFFRGLNPNSSFIFEILFQFTPYTMFTYWFDLTGRYIFFVFGFGFNLPLNLPLKHWKNSTWSSVCCGFFPQSSLYSSSLFWQLFYVQL